MGSYAHEPEVVRTIEALLDADYGEPGFPHKLVAMDEDARKFYERRGGAGAMGPIDDWLRSAASSQVKVAPHEIAPDQVAAAVTTATDAAERLLQTNSVRQALCAALKGASQDVFDIAKVITPVLTGASLAGTVAIGTPVLLYAVISLIVARAGIASICRGVES